MRGIPVPFDQIPKTATNLGRVQPSRGPQSRGDAGGFVRAAGDAALINARGFVVAEQSVGSIGQAVEQEGRAMAALAIKANEAVGIRQFQDAEDAMAAEQLAISADIAGENDETKWEGIAEKRMKSLSDNLMKGNYSPETRERISRKLQGWQQRLAGVTKVNARETSIRRAGQVFEQRLDLAEERQDFAGHEEALAEYKVFGGITDPGIELRRLKFDKAGKQKAVDAAYGIAVRNPAEFLREPEKYLPADATEIQKDSLMSQARQAKRQQIVDISNAFDDRLYGGEFKTLADLENAFPTDVLGEKAKAQAVREFIEIQKPGALAQREADAPANFARLTDEVEAYDPANDPEGEKYVRLNQDIKASLSESDPRGDLLNALQKKYNGTGAMQPPDPLKQSVGAMTSTMLEAGYFGVFTYEVEENNRKIIKEDPKKKVAAQAKRGEAMLYMDKWMRANPEATVTQANEAIRSFMAGKAPMIRATAPPPAPPAPSAPRPANGTRAPRQEDDLPEGDGGPDGGLIPFFLPPNLQSN